MDVVDFAHQVIEMHNRITALEQENERLRQYKKDYNDVLNESLAHSQAMIGNTLKLFLTPGVVEACQKNKTFHGDEVAG